MVLTFKSLVFIKKVTFSLEVDCIVSTIKKPSYYMTNIRVRNLDIKKTPTQKGYPKYDNKLNLMVRLQL